MSDDLKFEKYIDEKELAAFFRSLADALENGGKDELACVDDFKKMKLSVKNEYGQISLKAKIKTNKPCETGDGAAMETGESGDPVPAKPKYKALKKRMKGSFKMIFKMIHENQLPPKEAVDSFLEDSVLMCTYPGKGDEFYPVYLEACEAFKQAYEAQDMDALNKTVDELSFQKGHCHSKYD